MRGHSSLADRPTEDLPEAPDREEAADLDHIILDLLVEEEKMEKAAEKVFDTIQEMRRMLGQVEEKVKEGEMPADAYEQLCQSMIGAGLIEAAEEEYRQAADEIEIINNTPSTGKIELLVALGRGSEPNPLGAVITGAIPSPSVIRAAAVAVAAGMLSSAVAFTVGRELVEEKRVVDQAIDEYMEIAKKIEAGYEKFEETWARLLTLGRNSENRPEA